MDTASHTCTAPCPTTTATSSSSSSSPPAQRNTQQQREEEEEKEEELEGAQQEGEGEHMAHAPASPTLLAKKANTPLNRFGFPATIEFRGNEEEEAECVRKEKKREPLWREMLASWPMHQWKTKTLRRMALKGIPNSVRGEAWQRLTRSNELKESNPAGLYEALLQKESLSKVYIDKDVPRTWVQHARFRDHDGPGQQSLRNVLLAFSVYHPSLGYTSGMAWLPGLLLMYMPEEDAFWVFVRLCMDFGMEQIYASSDAMGMRRSFFILERLLPIFLPDLARHLDNEGISVQFFAARWLVTNFAFGLPFTAVVRFMDAFMVDGYDSTIVMIIALLSLLSDFLITQNFDGALQYFHTELEKGDTIHVNKLMKRYAKLSTKVRSKIDLFSRQWREQLERDGVSCCQANKIPRLVA